MKHATLAYIWGKVLVTPCCKYLVSMVTHVWPKFNKCSKMSKKCQIFTCLGTRIPTFSNIKRIAKLKGIPKNGVNQCIEIALNDF